MQYGTTKPYIGVASQIADTIITQVKLSGVITDLKARVYRSGGNQAINATTWTKIQLDGESFDVTSLYDNVTNYRFTVGSGLAGYYLIAAMITYSGSAAGGYGRAAIYKNGALSSFGQWQYQPDATAEVSLSVMDYLSLAANDYIEIWVYVTTAGNVINGSSLTWAYFGKLF